ncbi:MAG TPA: DUF433 domain-containing protein [Solirubrobacterales bacterium]|jgi:uncharacterized protein (DUF433 family)
MKLPRGAYPADRAAALSGVPRSTVHYWARQEILVPSVSPEKLKLWSYPDLMGLRIIYWLRHVKTGHDGQEVPASTMPMVKAILGQLAELDLALWSEDHGPRVRVDLAGKILVTGAPHPEDASGQAVLAGSGELDVLEPFPTKQGKGPHLVHPRPMLRIVPGKLGGSPHVVHTRLESRALGALAQRGMDTAKIYKLYPRFSKAAIRQAIDLEDQLERNLHPVAA